MSERPPHSVVTSSSLCDTMDSDTNNTDDRAPTADHNETETITVQHKWGEPERPGVSIVNAVAAATGRTMTDLPPLQQRVDPDALETLLTSSSSITITFSYAGTVVSAHGDGTIDLHVDPGRTLATQD